MDPTGFRLARVPNQTLRKKIVYPNDKINTKERTNVVCRLTCKYRPKYSVGKSERQLGTRIIEHQSTMQLRDETSQDQRT